MGLTQGAIYVNGHRVVGCDLTINNGMFIDTNNIVYDSFTMDSQEHTWTATEDCILSGALIGISSSQSSYIMLDGIDIVITYDKNAGTYVPVKKGQVVTYKIKTGSYVKAYGIQAGSIAGQKVTTYHGVPVTANIYDDGYCNLTKVEFDDFILYNLEFSIHVKGTSSGVEFLPFYTFDPGVLDDIDWRTMLTYCVYNDVYFARVRTKKEANALGGYWGNFSVSDGWYTCTPTTFLVQKNQPSS